MITADEFLDAIFAEAGDDEQICVTRAATKGERTFFNNMTRADRGWRKWDWEHRADAWYFCVSTVNGEDNAKGTMLGRGRANLMRAHCLVLDDISTKATPPPVEPSWQIETSPGNYQWGYMLEPTDRFDEYEALVAWCAEQGWSDAGAGGSYRVMRVPGSANTKPGRQNFRSRVTSFEDVVWTLDELAEDLGCDMAQLDVTPRRDAATAEGGAQALEGIDPMMDWLADKGAIVRDDGGPWVTIKCPWGDQHTTGDDTAGYSPLGRGSGRYIQTRSFKCMHEHCVERTLRDFRRWAERGGGPAVSGYDPMPWLQSRYVYIEEGQMVADMEQRTRGGIWQWSLADWSKKHPGKVAVPGRDQPVTVATAFIEHEDTRRAVSIRYVPVRRGQDSGVVRRFAQDYVNTYVPPDLAETDEKPEMFLEHVEYLIPCEFEREVFLNWMAKKIQDPASRSYACVMVAEDAYGTGRSWLHRLLSEMMPGQVNTATLGQLVGHGTAAEQNYNDWQVGCQFIVVEEARDTSLTRDDFYHGYQTFKQLVDTSVGKDVRINPKYGQTRLENRYFNALIFSNHADAMALEEEDRRVFAIENPAKRRSSEYYDRLAASLSSGEPARVYWWLMRRNISGYDWIYPPMTPTKAHMLETSRAPSDVILSWLVDNHPSDM